MLDINAPIRPRRGRGKAPALKLVTRSARKHWRVALASAVGAAASADPLSASKAVVAMTYAVNFIGLRH